MLTRGTRKVVLVLVLSFGALITSTFLQGATVNQTSKVQKPVADLSRSPPLPSPEANVDQTTELQKLRERVGTMEGRLQELSHAITASTQSTSLYTSYVTLGVSAVLGLFTLVGAVLGYVYKNWITSQVGQAETARKQVEQAEKQLSTSIAIARAVPALLRSNLEEKDPNRRRLFAREAYFYIDQSESKGYTDSQLLNWKAYTLRRMDLKNQALEAAQAALKLSTSDQPQRARALYNIACYYSAFFPGKEEEALSNLEQAILADERYKPLARIDRDFESIRNDPKLKQRFEEIVA